MTKETLLEKIKLIEISLLELDRMTADLKPSQERQKLFQNIQDTLTHTGYYKKNAGEIKE